MFLCTLPLSSEGSSACGRRVWRKTKSWTLPVWWIQLRHKNICWVRGTSCGPSKAVGQEMKKTVAQTVKNFIKTKYCYTHWHLINTKDLNKIHLFQDNFLLIPSIFITGFSQVILGYSQKGMSLTVCKKPDLWWKNFLSLINLFFSSSPKKLCLYFASENTSEIDFIFNL